MAEQDAFRRVADLRPEDPENVAALQQGCVPHARIEQRRSGLEIAEPVRRTVENPRHRHRVNHAVMPKDAHIGAAENLRLGDKVDAVVRRGDPRHLRPDIVEPVEIHHDAPSVRIDMHVRRGDVRRRDLGMEVVRHRRADALPARLEFGELLRGRLGRLGQKPGLREMQAARRMNRPGSGRMVGIGEPDIAALVIGEIQDNRRRAAPRPSRAPLSPTDPEC